MRIAVVGFGVEGRAALDHWRDRGQLTVHAARVAGDVPDGVTVRSGPDYLDGLDEADLIVRSPGVHPRLLPPGVPVTSVMSEFFARCPARIVGVTGTQGKGTTCTAAAAILRAAGRRAEVAGNIGVAPLALLPSLGPDDVVVLELSNFQLMDMTASPPVAVVLPVTPDHLNWHPDLAEYHSAKEAITRYQRAGDVVCYAAGNEVSTRIAALSPGRRVPVGTPDSFHAGTDGVYLGERRLVDRAAVQLFGRHNLENLAAAVAATWDLVAGDVEAVRAGAAALRPLPHRLAPVGRVHDVLYVNDSLSTTPHTAYAAIAAFDEPKVLILGGSSKGLAYDELASVVARADTRGTVLTGDAAPELAAALDRAGYRRHTVVPGAMPDVVAAAAALAQPGDVVLLSPACASFDRYRDYADRGNQFIAAVQALDEES